jgi:2-amino-4-hydroxy-6-hydroxymethyldihydropteridine diphosphokinase
MPRVGIALGSNLGDRLANLHAARDALREIAAPGEPFLQAAIYQTEPLHCPPGSPFFYNTVVEIAFEGDPHSLLESTRSIEKSLGRCAPAGRNAPRVIDVDLLYFGDCVIDTPALTLPHPRLVERRFVLQPLAGIRPELVLPGQARDIAGLLENLHSSEPPLIRVAAEPAEPKKPRSGEDQGFESGCGKRI